jgi:hypothetical protein
MWIFSPASRHRASSGWQLLPSDGRQRGFSLVQAPPVNAAQIDRRLTDAAAATGGELEISLAWNTLTDLDLEVRDPTGELTWAEHRRSASGGVQDVDANPTPLTPEGERRYLAGQIPGAENVIPVPDFMIDLPEGIPELDWQGSDWKAPSRYTRAPVEHIYFARAPKGTYTVYASCFWWREPDRNPLPCTILVRSRGKVLYQVSGLLGPANYVADGARPIQVCQFVIR